jgi:hypothetical protein
MSFSGDVADNGRQSCIVLQWQIQFLKSIFCHHLAIATVPDIMAKEDRRKLQTKKCSHSVSALMS